MTRAAACLFALTLIAAAPAAAQGPEAEWLTFSSSIFRLHCPATSQVWCERLAGRIEPAWNAVTDAVGFRPEASRIDIVVTDPAAAPNGSAWPLLGSPRIVLWSTPPTASSSLAHLNDWGELVLVHELAHLAHLLRPSRSPLRSLAERTLWPLGPLPTRTPRWAVEGYATMIEGRVTGSGRPHGAFRDAVLERFARDGQLPGYGSLSGADDGFLGASMAYLAGSTFLEWLETRSDPGALDRLWRRLTARVDRDFDQAFRGVFGDRPRELYSRFVAERTALALEHERARRPSARVGEPVVELAGPTGGLAVDASGTRLAYVERPKRRPRRLVVIETAPDAEAIARGDRRRARVLERDPEDAPAIAARTPPHRTLATLEAPRGTDFAGARFLADGSSLLFSRSARGRGGELVFDLYRLRVATGAVERLTRGAALFDPDPAPDGASAVAIERRDGASALARVDLATGAVERLDGPAVDRLFDQPRLSPDGRELAYLEHRGGVWRVRLRDLAGGRPTDVELPRGGEPVQLAWRPDGSHLYVAVARAGGIEIEALPLSPVARWHQVTLDALGAFAPALSARADRLYFLRLDVDGLDVASLALDAATLQPEAPRSTQASTSLSPPADRPEPTSSAASRPYGLGHLELRPLAAAAVGGDLGLLEAGARAGDLLGRFELVALGGGGETRGGRLAVASRALPIVLGLQAARVDLEARGAEERSLEGIEASASDRLYFGSSRFDWNLALARSRRRDGEGEGSASRARLDLELTRPFGRGALSGGWGVAADWTERLDGEGRVTGLAASLALGSDRLALRLEGERRDARAGAGPLEIGGAAGSLLPVSFLPSRRPHPALPDRTLSGTRFERLRVGVAPARKPVELFLERLDADGARIDLAGLEARLEVDAFPLLGLPRCELRLGVARATGAAAPERAERWWLSLALPARAATPTRRY